MSALVKKAVKENAEEHSALFFTASTDHKMCIRDSASAGVTLPHGLGMQIGGHCPHVTHGQSLAVFYPAFTRYTYPAAEHKFATVGRIFEPSLERESDAVAAERSCDAIDCFLKRIGLWINFRELNVTKEDIREIADVYKRQGHCPAGQRRRLQWSPYQPAGAVRRRIGAD